MWIESLAGFHRNLLKCSFGHDHASYPVVGLIAERTGGYGRKAKPGVHCPSCGIIEGKHIRSDKREFANFTSADLLGNFLWRLLPGA